MKNIKMKNIKMKNIKMRYTKILAFILICFSLVLLVSCKSEEVDNSPKVTILGTHEVVVDDEVKLIVKTENISDDEDVTWESSNDRIAKVSKDGVVKGISKGDVIIFCNVGEYGATYEITVLDPLVSEINVEIADVLEVGGNYEIKVTCMPLKADQNVNIEYDQTYIELEGNNIKTITEGNTELVITSVSNPSAKTTIELEIRESMAPTFVKKIDYSELKDVNYMDSEALVSDLEIEDNVDGDLSDKVTFDKELLTTYGIHDITLSVTDSVGNTKTFTRKINVVWAYHTKFIGHAGCTFGVPNTEEAFLFAAKDLKYQAIECDLQVTKDNIYVTNHDSTINGLVISEHTYNELKDIEIKYNTYTSHLCTLDRYLEICKEYGCIAVIEIKGSSPGLSSYSQDNIPKLIRYLQDKEMYDQSIILTSVYSCLIRIRTEGYDIPCQYLVNSCEDQNVLDMCNKYNFDLSTNVTYGGPNGDEWLKKYKDAGHKISVWTFSGSYDQVQEWIDKEVDFVTCDCHYMDKLELK